jgi:hypothetical protein
MQNVDYIIHADYVLPMDERLAIIRDGAVAGKGNKMLKVGPLRIFLRTTPRR